jgi:hypothetical protein
MRIVLGANGVAELRKELTAKWGDVSVLTDAGAS